MSDYIPRGYLVYNDCRFGLTELNSYNGRGKRMAEISIIIPVYNVEKYLAECLDSIVGQNCENMQVICIDDCSTDASPDILKRYAKKYSCIEIVHNERNLGLAEARNVGLEKATGLYILFVDGDDYLAPDILLDLYNECYTRNLDILEFDAESFADLEYKRKFDTQRRVHKFQYDDSTGVELLCQLIENKEMFGSVWIRIYRKEFILNNQISFIRGILHEDIPFSFRVLMMAERVGYYHKIVYYYRQRPGSIMNNSEYGQHWKGLWIGYMDMMRAWHDFLVLGTHDDQYNVCIGQYLDIIMSVMRNYYKEYCLDTDKVTDDFSQYINEKRFIDNRTLYDFFTDEDVDVLVKASRVSLFGAGKIAQEIIIRLIEKEIPVRKIYVTEKKGNRDSIAGIAVEQIDTYMEENKEDILVVAVSVNIQDEVEKIINKYCEGEIIKTIAV